MNKQNKVSELRRQLVSNGYSPIPNVDKACYMKGWPTVEATDEAIKRWGRMSKAKATGIRVENGLCVLDFDINHRIIDEVIDAVQDTIPDVDFQLLERGTKSANGKPRRKVAYFCRTDDYFTRVTTRRWIAPGGDPDGETHCVEVFGGASPRQFGSFGPHTVDDDGDIKVSYEWYDLTPEDVHIDDLPLITKEQVFAVVDAVERVLKRADFEPVKMSKKGEGEPGRIFDLTKDMVFQLSTGVTVPLKELNTMVRDGFTGRCSASWLEGPNATNRQRCLVSGSKSGHVAIWESATGDTHLPEDAAPPDRTTQVDRIAERLKDIAARRRLRISSEDDCDTVAAKLLDSHAYMTTSNKPVTPLWGSSPDAGMTLANFRTEMQPHCKIEIGPRGGEKKISPADLWLSNPKRYIIKGVRMRPDMPLPLFKEDGEQYANIYSPPNLGSSKGGTSEGGKAFMEQLIPDERERKWFMQLLAHKWAYPHIPGPAVIMVARDFGTGRGTFVELLKLMFGNQYVRTVDFGIFAGLSYQAQYTAWGLNALFAVVNESSAVDGGGSQYKQKHNVYEHLKEIIEPRSVEKSYVVHGEGQIRARSSMTSFIMTNNTDTLPLPADDRRFAVLTNGDKRDDEFWQYINEWMDKSANVAAFAEYLEGIDISDYNPYAVPIATRAKEEMVALNTTPLDTLLQDALNEMEGYFVPEQVLRKMAEAELRANIKLPDHWQAMAKRGMRKIAWPVLRDGQRSVEIKFNKVRYSVLHTDRKVAESVNSALNIRKLVLVNGDIFGGGKRPGRRSKIGSKLQSHLKLVKSDDDDE